MDGGLTVTKLLLNSCYIVAKFYFQSTDQLLAGVSCKGAALPQGLLHVLPDMYSGGFFAQILLPDFQEVFLSTQCCLQKVTFPGLVAQASAQVESCSSTVRIFHLFLLVLPAEGGSAQGLLHTHLIRWTPNQVLYEKCTDCCCFCCLQKVAPPRACCTWSLV